MYATGLSTDHEGSTVQGVGPTMPSSADDENVPFTVSTGAGGIVPTLEEAGM
jgi:hypothetical protein